jgi:L-asparaginase II
MIHKELLTVEVIRGDLVESRHRGIAAVIDAHGEVVHAWGDIDRHIYPRSAIKPLQALPLIETGAAENFNLSEPEIAISCASHNGEPHHADVVSGWLRRIGLGADDLECGRHLPYDEESTHSLIRSGKSATNLNSNCSGKHTGFLTTAVHAGEPTRGYIGPDHPVQQRLETVLSEMSGIDLSGTERGADGCGIPVIGMPLSAMALALARMANPENLAPPRAAAAKRITTAMMAHPYNVAGRNRFDTIAMQAAPGRFAVKTGAEAVHAGIVPELGLGIALKIDDGSKRAADVAMAAILQFLGLLDGAAETKMADLLEASIHNIPGERVGSVRMAEGWAD